MFITVQKTKEIGIRKVNGVKVWEMMALLNKDFVRWVTIAFFIATNAWYAMNKWLENFVYDIVMPLEQNKIELVDICLARCAGFGNCLADCELAAPIAIGGKAAIRNPVDVLKYE